MQSASPHPHPPSHPRPRPAAPSAPRPLSSFRHAFTLIELLVVIGIIAVLTAITVPTIRSLSKSNDQSQATSLIRAMISNARAIAISQHRMAGVVFFRETSAYSQPVHGNAVAMQLIIEDYNQARYNFSVSGLTGFYYYNTARQYLPDGIEVAMLSDLGSGVATVENGGATASASQQTRVLLFNADGQIILRNGLASADPGVGGGGSQGIYPTAVGDWLFLAPDGTRHTPTGNVSPADAFSSPGFFLYSRTEMDAQTFPDDITRASWLRNHSSVVLVNANTGSVIK